MTGSPLIHRVPYYSQWESAALVPEFITGTRAAADDPLWPKSGADTREEYAFWAPRMCGMACLRMALDYWGHEVPPSVPLLREALEAGAYVQTDEQVKGLIYAPFARWVARRWDLYADVRPELTAADISTEIARGHVVLLSVHKTIRTLDPAPPQRGGHLVLAVGTGRRGVLLHNPSGLPGQSQEFHHVPWTDLDRFFAGRGVVLGPHAQGATLQ
ncbi:C39 family peptidase [Streptomyces sp. NBC_00872]|uniref:C39 family peptidase n=1 Tax=Streptomyces sp. NBC_00872 TaxID=2903686 RepID=UPI003867CDFC|nr:C39 family peptidase [Streptomyces sp. NBC_00872]